MTAIMMGAVCSAPTWVMNAAVNAIANGAATRAPATAANMQVNVSPRGTLENVSWTMTPAVPPMNNEGKIGPPMKPLPILSEGEDLRKQDRY